MLSLDRLGRETTGKTNTDFGGAPGTARVARVDCTVTSADDESLFVYV